jgi:hypothetical protein
VFFDTHQVRPDICGAHHRFAARHPAFRASASVQNQRSPLAVFMPVFS